MAEYIVLSVVGGGDYAYVGVFDGATTSEAVRKAVISAGEDGHYVAIGKRSWKEHNIVTLSTLAVEDIGSLSYAQDSRGSSHPEPAPLDISPLLTPQAH